MTNPLESPGLKIIWIRLDQANFQRQDQRPERQIVQEVQGEDVHSKIQFEVSIKVDPQDDDDNRALVLEHVQASSQIRGVSLWRAECLMQGAFLFVPGGILSRQAAFEVNAAAILYPYCREFIGDMVRRAGSSVILPPMLFSTPSTAIEPGNGIGDGEG